MIYLAVFLGCSLGVFLSMRTWLQDNLVDWLIRHGKLVAMTKAETAYLRGLNDSVKIIDAERTHNTTNQEKFVDAMRQISKIKRGADARRFAKAWLAQFDNAK